MPILRLHLLKSFLNFNLSFWTRMTGGCFTKGKEADSGNTVGGKTRGRLASSNNSRSTSSGQANGGLIKGCSTATDGIQTRPRRVVPNVTPTRKTSRPDAKLVNGQAKEDVKQIGDNIPKRVQPSVTSDPGPGSENLPAVPKKNGVEIPSTRPVAKTPTKQKSSDVAQALKIEAKALPVNTTTDRNSIRIGSENQNDKSPRTQNRTTTRSNGSSVLQRKTNEVEKNLHAAESSKKQKTKVTSQVEGQKIKSTALASQSTSSLGRLETSNSGQNRGNQLDYNVVIDQDLLRQRDIQDCDNFDNTLGISCALCEKDLMSLPPHYEYHDGMEPNLPEVAVLHCGHAFHSACLEDIIPPEEHCREPPCYFCLSNID